MNKNLIDNFIFKTETNNESVQSINLNMVTETDNDFEKNQVNNKINRFPTIRNKSKLRKENIYRRVTINIKIK
jgi:hypothetical protein